MGGWRWGGVNRTGGWRSGGPAGQGSGLGVNLVQNRLDADVAVGAEILGQLQPFEHPFKVDVNQLLGG